MSYKLFGVKKIFIIILFFILILAILLLTSWLFIFNKGDGQPFVKIGDDRIFVEIADNETKRTKGLSQHPPLCPDCGMLFIFPDKAIRSFWMKEMNYALDIVWINDERIVGISKDLSPEGEWPKNTYPSPEPVNYVLEINAGRADELGFKDGDLVEFSDY